MRVVCVQDTGRYRIVVGGGVDGEWRREIYLGLSFSWTPSVVPTSLITKHRWNAGIVDPRLSPVTGTPRCTESHGHLSP